MSSSAEHRYANGLALGAIAMWGSLGALGAALTGVPPLLLTGLALLIGSVISLVLVKGDIARLRVNPLALAVGVYGLFGYHFLLFTAFRLAPPVESNLINYLWPLGIVVLAPRFLPGVALTRTHVIAALLGLAGAAIVILGRTPDRSADAGRWTWLGYLCAFGAAVVWSTYSLLTKRLSMTGRGAPTAAIGTISIVSGVFALVCHRFVEDPATASNWPLIVLLGIGPLGGAFYLWDAALKRGDATQIGILSYLTPLISTVALLVSTHRPLTWSVGLGTVVILGAAVLGTRSNA